MSIFKDRLVRFITNDMYLPWKCYATRFWMISSVGYCNCMIDCKFLKMPNHPS